jgi:cysteinyl-tRNA synthetase
MNISAAIASIFQVIKRINRLATRGELDPTDACKLLEAFRGIDTVLRIFRFRTPGEDPELRRLLEQREAARRAGNWELADRLREKLLERGVCVRDERIGI